MKWFVIILAIASFGILVARLCKFLMDNYVENLFVDDPQSDGPFILRCGDRYFQRWEVTAVPELEGPPSYESHPIFTDDRDLAMRFETRTDLEESIADLHQFHRMLTPEPVHAVSDSR